MADSTLYVSINKGASGMNDADFTIQSTTNAGADFEFRSNAADANSNLITRLDMVLAIKAILHVLESDGINTTDLAQ